VWRLRCADLPASTGGSVRPPGRIAPHTAQIAAMHTRRPLWVTLRPTQRLHRRLSIGPVLLHELTWRRPSNVPSGHSTRGGSPTLRERCYPSATRSAKFANCAPNFRKYLPSALSSCNLFSQLSKGLPKPPGRNGSKGAVGRHSLTYSPSRNLLGALSAVDAPATDGAFLFKGEH
jgi:hypothetical protein